MKRVKGAIIGHLVALMLAAIAPVATRAQTIPSRIADSTFWRMVTSLSEPNGPFLSDNFVSNENEWQTVIPGALTRVKAGGVYLGVGPEQNFTYIAAFQPRIAFICDIRRQNMIEHLMYKALVEMSADRAGLLSLLWSRPRPPGVDSASTPLELLAAYGAVNSDTAMQRATLAVMFNRLVTQHHFVLGAEDSTTLRTVFGVFALSGPDISYAVGGQAFRLIINGDTTWRTVPYPAFGRVTGYASFASLMLEDDGAGMNRGWLGSENAFRWLKDFHARNLLVPIVGDFAGPRALRAVGDFLRANDARVNVFYTSNVEQYLYQSATKVAAFYENVATLPRDSGAIFIRSAPNSFFSPARNPQSRLAQIESGIEEVLRAHRERRLATYRDLIEIQFRSAR